MTRAIFASQDSRDSVPSKSDSIRANRRLTLDEGGAPNEPEGTSSLAKNKLQLVNDVFRSRTCTILIGAACGLVIGILLTHFEANDEVVSWVALPGNLFLRGLKCVVLPLVFVNIILAVVEMLSVGKAVSIGWKTIALYTFTTFLAACEGLFFVLLFKPMFNVRKSDIVADEGPALEAPSLSKTLQTGIFLKMVPGNILQDYVNNNFLGVIMFAIAIAVASQKVAKKSTTLFALLNELNDILLMLITFLIYLTPPAVASLISGALGSSEGSLNETLRDISVLVAATLSAMSVHAMIVYPSLFYFFVRECPFSYLKHIVPAMTMAFASASSAATLPVTMKCVDDTKQVPSGIRNFVLSIGATINMDGGAIYFPTSIIFLAVSGGFGDKLGAAPYILILILSTIGSAGSAPVPSASLALIITAFNTVFDTEGTPSSFGYILAIDWFIDRFRTIVNVTGDTIVTRIVTSMEGDNFPMITSDENGECRETTDLEVAEPVVIGNGA